MTVVLFLSAIIFCNIGNDVQSQPTTTFGVYLQLINDIATDLSAAPTSEYTSYIA